MSIRVVKITSDINRAIAVGSTGAPLMSNFNFIRGDDNRIDLDIVTVDISAETMTAFGFDDGTVFRVVGKKAGAYDGPELVLAEPTAFNLPGSRPDLSPVHGRLSVKIKLNRKALLDALGGSNKFIDVVIDFEAITIHGEVSTILQLHDRILNDAARNQSQIDDNPAGYLSLDEFRAMLRQVTHPDGGTYRIEDGQIKLIDIVHQDFVGIGLNDYAVGALEDS